MNSKFLNKIKPLLLSVILVSILFLIIPHFANALIFADGIGAALDGLEEKVGPISAFMIEVTLIYFKSLAALGITTWLFDWMIRLNLEHITINTSMVDVGWEFISGIANMALILIFIYLAFAIILKIESVGAKKILPKLIIVALLLNFSRVFIGMAIDITNIFYATFLPDGNLIWLIIDPFWKSALGSIIIQGATITTIAGFFMIPGANVAAQIGLVLALPTVILPQMAMLVFQTITFLILSITFLPFVLVFGARIVIIQMLTVLAPLAFICLILPKTKKYFDMWLKHFIGWLIVGIFFLFFLRLGFLLFGVLKPDPGFIETIIPWFNIGEWLAFSLVVIIYLLTLLVIAKKTMPEAAQGVVSAVEGFVKHATIGWGVKAGGTALKKFHSRLAPTISKESHKISDAAEGWAKKGGVRGVLGRYAIRRAEEVGINAEQSMVNEVKEKEKKCEVMTGPELIKAIKYGDSATQTATARFICNKGKAQGLIEDGSLTPNDFIRIHRNEKKRATNLEKDIENALPQFHKEFGITKKTDTDEENKKALTNLLKGTFKKPELLTNMSPEIWDDKEMQPILLDLLKGQHIGEIAKSGNAPLQTKVEEVITDKIKRDGFPKFAEEHISLATYLSSTTARGGAGFRDVINLPENKKNKIIKIINESKTTGTKPKNIIDKYSNELLREKTKIKNELNNIRTKIKEKSDKDLEYKFNELKKQSTKIENEFKEIKEIEELFNKTAIEATSPLPPPQIDKDPDSEKPGQTSPRVDL